MARGCTAEQLRARTIGLNGAKAAEHGRSSAASHVGGCNGHGELREGAVRPIVIRAGEIEARAELNDTRTATAIWEALPIEVRGSTWGDEIYFAIPVKMKTERGQETVALGDLGYWEPGNAFCIFFGPTPASYGQEIRPASPVTVIGRCLDDARQFKANRSGEPVRLEQVQTSGG
jgi:hypothetical protein